MVELKLFVEGGGDGKALRTECRKAFSEFLRKTGLAGLQPRTVASGGRQQAYEDFCTAVRNGEAALLLVDSEVPVSPEHQQAEPAQWQPWGHLSRQPGDGWSMPPGAGELQCHLMVVCMESWLLADRESLRAFFDPGFSRNALPAVGRPVESLNKVEIYKALAAATRHCKTKAPYGKGQHSFKVLAQVDPTRVMAASPWARRFVEETRRRMGA